MAFVGSSGAGKSTLLNLLPRFHDPCTGTVALDGRDVRTIKLGDLRKHIASALQDSIILPTTIWENISYGRPFAPLEDVLRAARLAGASGSSISYRKVTTPKSAKPARISPAANANGSPSRAPY